IRAGAGDSTVGTDWPRESGRLAKDMSIKIIIIRMYLFVLIPSAAFFSSTIVGSCLRVLFLDYGVDFRDVSPRELHDSGFSLVGLIRRYEHVDAACFGLSERVRQIRHFISGRLPAVRIRKVTVGNHRGQLAELRFDPHSPIGFCGSSDFDTGCARFIRDDTPVRKRDKAGHKCIRSVLRDIDPVLRNSLERGIRWRGGVPVQLCVHATRPLNDCVSANRIVESSNEHVCASRFGGTDRFIHVSDQIACALQPEWIWHRRLEPENRQCSYGGQHQLNPGAAGCRSYGEHALLRSLATECLQDAGNESIEIRDRNVDMRRVVLWSNSHANRSGRLRTLGECVEVLRFAREADRQKDRKRRSNEGFFQAHSISPKAPITSSLRNWFPCLARSQRRSPAMYVGRIYFVGHSDMFSKDGT